MELQLNDVRKRLADRRVTLDVKPAAIESPVHRRLRPGLRCASVQAPRAARGRRSHRAEIVEGKLPDRSHVLIDIDEAADDYVCKVEPPLELDAVRRLMPRRPELAKSQQ